MQPDLLIFCRPSDCSGSGRAASSTTGYTWRSASPTVRDATHAWIPLLRRAPPLSSACPALLEHCTILRWCMCVTVLGLLLCMVQLATDKQPSQEGVLQGLHMPQAS